MNKMYYRDLAYWVERQIDLYVEYLNDGGERRSVNQSGDWDSGSRVRASSMDGCPKFHAAERHHEVKKKFDTRKKWQFELANRAADVAKEAIVWMAQEENNIQGSQAQIIWDTYTEHRVESNTEYAGTMDALIVGRVKVDKHNRTYMYIPQEIKRTNADAHDGITAYQVWQLITYMKLLNAEAGFLITIYDTQSSSGTHKVWPIVREGEGWSVLDGNGENAVFESDNWPVDDMGANRFTEQQFQARITNHQLYYDNPDLPPPYDMPTWRCGYVKPIETYQRGYTHPSTGKKYKAGDIKPGSGTVRPGCPLFGECWKHQLNAAGYRDVPVEVSLEAWLEPTSKQF